MYSKVAFRIPSYHFGKSLEQSSRYKQGENQRFGTAKTPVLALPISPISLNIPPKLTQPLSQTNSTKIIGLVLSLIVCATISSGALAQDIVPSVLSLIVEEGTNVDRDPRVVKFPFDPSQKADQQWMMWKGSAGAPPLVFDPTRSGKVSSGEQLLGTWTFGGKSEGDKKYPWKDGYAPLVSLDDNLDGKLSGMELRGLALWLDRNRNGRSDPGEYKAIGHFGVTTINLLPENTDEKTGMRWSTRGFQYVKNGITFTGWSVSWPTKVLNDEATLRAVIDALPTPCVKGDSGDYSECPVENQQQNLGSIETHYRP